MKLGIAVHRCWHARGGASAVTGFLSVVIALWLYGTTTSPAAEPDLPREIRSIYLTPVASAYPRSIAYSSGTGELLLLSGNGNSFLTRLSPAEGVVDSLEITALVEDAEIFTFDPARDRALVGSAGAENLVSINGVELRGSTGSLERPVGGSQVFGLKGGARGAVFDDDGTLFMLDQTGRQIIEIPPSAANGLDFDADSAISIQLRGGPLDRDLRGLALNPNSGNFFMFGSGGQRLVEFDHNGAQVDTHALKDAALKEPLSMVFAPSGDPTDSPEEQSLYVVDGSATAGVSESTRIVELSFSPASLAASIEETAALLQTIDLSQFSPPIPDPAGITYIASDDTLLLSDSEVEEIPTLFTGFNLFDVSRNGVLVNTGTTTDFSLEPTGLGIDPATGRMFITDDDTRDVFVIQAGGDGLFGTTDDVMISQFETNVYGNTDPEGVTYDSLRNEVVTIDGLGREVYRISPGPNGLFDGIDDVTSHFDVQILGADDPEGIHYDAVTDTLLIAERGPDRVLEVTADGTLLRTIDISAAGSSLKAAGITVAPSSENPALNSMYITDRGADNDGSPMENDGVLYEFSFPELNGNRPPSVDAGPDQTLIGTQTAQLAGAATDDGLPDPPNLTTDWSQVSGPAAAVFEDLTAPDSSVSFPVPGVYVLRLNASDGELQASDDVTLSVSVLNLSVAAGTDDAEERTSGSVQLSSSDLELVFDSGGNQIVGLRFTDVAVPPGANVTAAWLQFQVDEVDSGDTNLIVHGEATDNSLTFSATRGNVSGRPTTLASVSWQPPPWETVGASGPEQQSTDISPLIQEIVDRSGWQQGNSLSFIISGDGVRTAESFDGTATGAPRLHIEFSGTAPANRPPVANPDAATTSAATTISIDVVSNDSDPDGNLDPGSATVLCAIGCNSTADGLLVNDGEGTFSYTPNNGFTGIDGFTYEVCDTTSLCDTAAVTISVTVTNDPPMANDDNVETDEDTPLIVDVVGNDVDPDGNLDGSTTNTLCLACSSPANGSLVNSGDGSFSYSPNLDFNGQDSFIYEVCDLLNACDTATASITVNPVNDAPIAVDDDASTVVDSPVTIPVTANDVDVDNDLMANSANTLCSSCTDPASGTLGNLQNGSFTYTPDTGFEGSDTFTYEVCDSGNLCDTANVLITVSGSVAQTVEFRVATAANDAEESTSGSVSLSSSDLELVTDGSRGEQIVGMRFTDVSIPQGAVVSAAWLQFQVDEIDTGFIELNLQAESSDSSAPFSTFNGNLSSRIRSSALVPWSPPDWTTVGAAGAAQRSPNLAILVQEIVNRPGWAPGQALTLLITGSGVRTAESYNGTAAGAPLLHVEYFAEPVPNRPPDAVADTAATIADTTTPLLIDVVANDLDPDGNLEPASANTGCTTCSNTSNGILTNNGNGTFGYTPNSGFVGQDDFTYEVCDLLLLCDTAAVTITISNALAQTIEVRVAANSDDAEESDTGSVGLNSSDLELVEDGNRGAQLVGMRFTNVTIPVGAVITTAWVQFQADEADSLNTTLTIQGQAADNPPGFTTVRGSIGSRPRTVAQQTWSPPEWLNADAAGVQQRTTDITAVIQEIVNRTGWSTGQAMVLVFTGTGTRTAESFNGSPAAAPLLHVEFLAP